MSAPNSSRTLALFAVSFVACVALVGCRHLSPPTLAAAPKPVAEDAYKEVRLFTTALMQIRHNYVDADKTGYHDLVYGALRGLLQSLDAHSQFMEPKLYEDMKTDTAGAFGGIGIQIGLRDGMLTVIAPMEDTPAYRAGVLAGDKIVEVDGTKTDGMSIQDAVGKLRGTTGTTVKVKILRNHETTLRDLALVREIIKVASVKGARLIDGKIGYVRITQFSEPTADALQKALDKLLGQGMNALVLDLRNNPGGLLVSAIAVSEQFLHKGDLIVSTRGRPGPNGQPALLKEEHASVNHRHPDFPIVVLVNRGSASASEIVSGALQDHKRAVLIGERTYGKASVQSVLQLEDGSALRLTTARYYTPSMRIIQDKGIEPDVVVPVTGDEWRKVQLKRMRTEEPQIYAAEKIDESLDNVTDRQLDRAVDLLKGILIFEAK